MSKTRDGCARCDGGFVSVIERRRLGGALIETVAACRCDCTDGQKIDNAVPRFAAVVMSPQYVGLAGLKHGWWYVAEEEISA